MHLSVYVQKHRGSCTQCYYASFSPCSVMQRVLRWVLLHLSVHVQKHRGSCSQCYYFQSMFGNTDSPMLSSRSPLPWLRSHKLLIWRPWGVVLTGEMYYDWRLRCFISECASVLTLKVLFRINQATLLLFWALCFSLWGTHSGHCWSFSHIILFVTFWLAGAAVVIDSWEPLI